MKSPKPVKAWIITEYGHFCQQVFIGKGARKEAKATLLSWQNTAPSFIFGMVRVLITPIPPKRKAKGKRK